MGLSLSEFEILAQPDDLTCGPTCLQAVYSFYDDAVPLSTVISEVPQLKTGGTLAVLMGVHALQRGYRATLHSWDLELFDPTWFEGNVDLAEKLAAQAWAKGDAGHPLTTAAYIKFLSLGGKVRYAEFEPEVLRRYIRQGRPVLTGLSATYLYGCARERDDDQGNPIYDDVGGRPAGHFVVVWKYDSATKLAWLADPLHDNPLTGSHVYAVSIQRLLGAILLGGATYDANFLVIDRGTSATT